MKDNSVVIITPNQLEAGATIPQVLDNQYVSDEIYFEIVTQKKSLNDSGIAKKRAEDAKNEFIRSLIYSSQVVINRAFISNNELLYRYYMPGNDNEAVSFAAMLNSGVIVPYLYKENGLYDEKKFDLAVSGESAAKYLSQFLNENIKCVRFSKDDAKNDKETDKLSNSFRQYFQGLSTMDGRLLIEMLGELSGGKKEISDDDQLEFRENLEGMDRFVKSCFKEQGSVNRNDFYAKFITAPNTNVADGVYLPPDKDNCFRHEVKKLIDLKYNTNLPDLLRRYSFTPSGMPTRSALQDGFQIEDIDCDKVDRFIYEDFSNLAKNQRIFMANTQRAMVLPVLSELSLGDVLEVRSLESWGKFIQLQSKILSNPLSVGNEYDKFQSSFEGFQSELSSWYYRKYGENQVKEKYTSIATIVLGVAGRTIIYGMDGLDVAAKVALAELPTVARGIAVKLMMNVFNSATKHIDKKRSYSIEIMRSELELTKTEIIGFIENVSGSQIISRSNSMIAEQDRS